MRAKSPALLFVATLLVASSALQAQALDPLAACGSVDRASEMPDPTAPSFYGALPTNAGMVQGAGFSAHVNSWFRYMRDERGGIGEYQASRRALEQTLASFEKTYVARAGAIEQESRKSTFNEPLLALKKRSGAQAVELTNRYVQAADSVGTEYVKLRAALLDIQEARSNLVVVQSDYSAFLIELKISEAQGEKGRLIAEAREVQELVTRVVSGLAGVSGAPVTASSVGKSIAGQSFLIDAAFGPDVAALASLDAKLADLDRQFEEHRRKGFTERLKQARSRLERSALVAEASARAIPGKKFEMYGALQSLAAIEAQGQGFGYFRALQSYYKDIAAAAAPVDEAAGRYGRFIQRNRPAEASLLQRRIEVDIDHVNRTQPSDSTGEWLKLARNASTFLRDPFVPWQAGESRRVDACQRSLKELRHLQVVDREMNEVTRLLDGIPPADLKKYVL